jgi:hypothetical protein
MSRFKFRPGKIGNVWVYAHNRKKPLTAFKRSRAAFGSEERVLEESLG